MKVTTVVVLALMIGVAGTWATGKKLNDKQIAGAIILLLMFAAMDELIPDIASGFSWLLLATTASNYAVPLFSKLGNVTAGSTPDKPAGKPKPSGGPRAV
jgi:hypothetical protein